MKYSFDYFYTMQPMDSYECEDLSNFTLEINTDDAIEYFIDVQTELGETIVKHFGPLKVDDNEFGNAFEFKYCKFQFNEQKIIKLVDKLLNNNKMIVTQVKEIDREEFYNRLDEVMKCNG